MLVTNIIFSCSLLWTVVVSRDFNENNSLSNTTENYFLKRLFRKYGHDGFITFEGFEHLLVNLGLGNFSIWDHDIHDHFKNSTFKEIHDDHNHVTDDDSPTSLPFPQPNHAHHDHDKGHHHPHKRHKKKHPKRKKLKRDFSLLKELINSRSHRIKRSIPDIDDTVNMHSVHFPPPGVAYTTDLSHINLFT